MALFLGLRENDVLAWRGTSELFASLKKDLADHSTLLLCDEQVELLRSFDATLMEEINFQKESGAEFTRLLEELKHVNHEVQLIAVHDLLRQRIWHYFQRRNSVVALQDICNRVNDALLVKAIEIAAQEVGNVPSYCWFVAGPAGRAEQGIHNWQRHLVVHRDGDRETAAFRALCRRTVGILKHAGVFHGDVDLFLHENIWYGTIDDWEQWLVQEVREKKQEHYSLLDVLPTLSGGIKPLARTEQELLTAILTLSDLRLVTGDDSLAKEVENASDAELLHVQKSQAFDHLVRVTTTLPVALNMFGWFRLEKRGRHRGELDMDHHVLEPLVTCISLLALKHRIPERHTLDRVRELVNRGAMNVDLAEKIFRAYHEIQRQIILVTGLKEQDDESCFLNPEDLSEKDWHALKQALETVVTTQKTINHEFLEMQ